MADAPAFPMTRGPWGTASMRYAQGQSSRENTLRRARDNAALTIPWLYREQGSNESTLEEVPWNSSGAYMLANMAAKLILVLFPVGRAPMKLKPGQKTQADLAAQAQQDPDKAGDLAAAIDVGLSQVEQQFVDCVDEDGDRSKLAIGAMKLLCGGNHGFQINERTGLLRGISLDRYCTWRDAEGTLLEFVIEDSLAYQSLPDEVKAHVNDNGYVQPNTPGDALTPILLYTHAALQNGRWKVYQEVYGMVVPGSEYERDPDALSYFFPVWQLLDGENYGRSYVEHYVGDLQTVEGITQTVSEGAAAIAKLLTLVAPGGLTSKKAVAEAPNGAVISGRADDVHVVPNNKGGDLQFAVAVSDKAEKRLAAAFLLNSSVQRQGERVTAEEIRFVAQELEDAQAGAYSQQVVTWQMPYARIKLFFLMKSQRITRLPMKSVKVTIVGGMGGLARNAELAALDSFLQGALQSFGPDSIKYINMTVYWKRRAAALGVNPDGLIYSEQYMQAQQQAEQQQQMAQQLGPDAIKAGGDYITKNSVAAIQAGARQPGGAFAGQAPATTQ